MRARPRQLAADLRAGVAHAHHQHPPSHERLRPAVLHAVQQPAAEALTAGDLRRQGIGDDARGDDEGAGVQRPLGCGGAPAAVLALEARDGGADLHWQPERLGVAAEILPEIGPGHERGVVAGEFSAGEVRHPLAGVQRQAVIEVRPGVADHVAALQHAVGDPPRRELLRGREPAGPRADHQDIHYL